MAEVLILGGMLVAGYVTVALAVEDEEEEEEQRARYAARTARGQGFAEVAVRVLRAEDLVDATWTGVQDVRAIVDVTHRDTGEHLGRAASAVAHDSGTTPTWGDRGRHGLIRVAVPASYPPESLRIIISLESQSYVAEHVDLGHAETDFFAPSTARVLEVDPRGTLSCRVGYTPPDPRHVPRAEFEEAVVAAQTITADECGDGDDEVPLERTPLFSEPAVATEMELPEMRPTRRPTVVAAPVQPVQARPARRAQRNTSISVVDATPPPPAAE